MNPLEKSSTGNINDQKRKRLVHADISASIASFSPVVTIHVGKKMTEFHVPLDLLKLHSGYFLRVLNNASCIDDSDVYLPDIDAILFANFVIWLHSGKTIAKNNKPQCSYEGGYRPDDGFEGLWIVAEKLEAPVLQNYCLDNISQIATGLRASSREWPQATETRYIYDNTPPNSLIRKLAASALTYNSPFGGLTEKDPEWKQWRMILQARPDLSADMHCVAAAARLAGPKSWSEEWVKQFVVDEGKSLEERWEDLILENRSKEAVFAAAGEGCVKSMIEKGHLRRER